MRFPLAVCGIFFLACLGVLLEILYRHEQDPDARPSVLECLQLIILILVLSWLTVQASAPVPGAGTGLAASPGLWIGVLALSVLLAVLTALRLRKIMKQSRQMPSPSSIREALDNLGTGVCFADREGRILLINRAMGGLISSITGSYPQITGDIDRALAAVKKAETEAGGGAPGLYHFPDGTVRQFREIPLAGSRQPQLRGCIRITAQDVTELYDINRRLQEENRELERINKTTRALYERLADRIREQEALDLKIRIHDEIGLSLMSISSLLREGHLEDMDRQMEILRSAVSYLAGARDGEQKEDAEDPASLRQKAAELGVDLRIRGAWPKDPEAAQIAAAAARECVTNCIRHAGGNLVEMTLSQQGGRCLLSITNDGAPPAGPVREGSGLSTLRHMAEHAGGSMEILSSPRFELKLELKTELK